MAKIKKNDIVMVLAGRDKGKTGKTLKIFPKKSKVIVEGVNFVKKHLRRTREDQKGGIIQKESPIDFSNLAIFCKGCSKPTKVGYNLLKDGTNSRFCKKCNEVF